MVTIPPLLSDLMIRALEREITLEVVVYIHNRNGLQEALKSADPELVMIGLFEGEAGEIAGKLFAAAPAAKVIAFSSDCRNAYVHELQANPKILVDVRPAQLVAAILGLLQGRA
jgi:DNA-binding NarL/FixJ family response regulator